MTFGWDLALLLIMVAAATILLILLWSLKLHLNKINVVILLIFVILAAMYAAAYFQIPENWLFWGLFLYILLLFLYLLIVKVIYPLWWFFHGY